MTRVALDTYWVELARADGTTTRLGVTSEHPMFVAGKGWLPVGEVEAGDKIRDAALCELLVLSVEADDNPQRVHNLEIADAHTYFAGELEAWGHNNNAPPPNPSKATVNGECYTSNFPNDHGPAHFHVSGGGSLETSATEFIFGIVFYDTPGSETFAVTGDELAARQL